MRFRLLSVEIQATTTIHRPLPLRLMRIIVVDQQATAEVHLPHQFQAVVVQVVVVVIAGK